MARLFSNAHECGGSDNDANMDYYKNSIGHSIGMSYPEASAYVIADRVCDKLEAGHLKILEDEDDTTSALINSHSCTCN